MNTSYNIVATEGASGTFPSRILSEGYFCSCIMSTNYRHILNTYKICLKKYIHISYNYEVMI